MPEPIADVTARMIAKLPQHTPEQREAAQMRKRELLAEISPCDIDCACGGLGFVSLDVPITDFRFGKLQPCPNVPAANLHEPGHYGLLFDEQQNLTWHKVLDFGNSKAAARQVYRVLARGHGWIYLHGTFGTAKTLILKIAIAETLRNQTHAEYVRMVDMLDDLKATFDTNEVLADRVAHWCNVPVLAIDEIDRFKSTDWSEERIFQIIDRRYSSALADQSVTLIASNKAPEMLGPDGYLASRIRDGRFEVVRLDGEDMRTGMTPRSDIDEIEEQYMKSVFDTGE